MRLEEDTQPFVVAVPTSASVDSERREADTHLPGTSAPRVLSWIPEATTG